MRRLPPALETPYFPFPPNLLNAARGVVLALLAALLWPATALAQTAWDGSTDTSWGVADNWTAGVPTGSAAITFGNNATDTAQTIDLGGNRTITTGGSLLVSSTGNRSYTLNGSTLIFDRTSTAITLINNSAGTTAFTINSNIHLANTANASNPVFTISGAANRTINLNGNITAVTGARITLNSANASLNLRGTNILGQFTITSGEVVARSASATGSGQLAGGGTNAILSLASDLNLSGGTSSSTFLSGNLQIRIREDSSSSADRTINFLTRVGTQNANGSITIADNINSTGRVILNITNSAGATAQHVPIDLGTTGVLRFSQTGSTIYGGGTASGIISGAGSVEITGGGSTTYTAANTYTGTTTISSGNLTIDANMAIGAIAGSGGLTINASRDLTSNSSTTNTFSGVIRGAGNFTKAGTGTQILTGSNTHNGTVTISAGTLQLGNGGDTGSLNATATITNDATLAFNRSDIVTQGTHFSTAAISGTGTLAQIGSGTLVLNAANTYTGGTTLNAGTIQLAAANALGTSGNITFGGGTLQYGSGISSDLSPRLKNSASAIAIDTNNQAVTFASAIDSTNAGGLTKSGAGTLTLNATNSYTGATTVNAGTLAVNGSIATSSLTTINSGAALVGSGTLGALTIASGGTMNPGNSPGTLTVGDTTWSGGGNYNWQIHDATGSAGTGWDLLASTGTLTIGATSGDKFKINLWSLSALSPDTNGTPINFNASSNYAWNIANFSSISGFSDDKFQVVASASNGTGGFSGFTGLFSISSNGTVLTLNYTAPSATANWTAGSGDWSTGANWQSGTVPSNGNPLEFTGAGGTSTNNGALTSVGGIEFTSGAGGSYTINGSALQIATAGILNNSTYAQTVATDLTLAVAQSFSAAAANLTVSGAVDNVGRLLTAAGNNTLFLQGAVSGAGGLTREDNGLLVLSAANTYTGTTTITAGTLQIGAGGATGSLESTSIVNNGTLVVDRTGSLTLAAAISGNGSLAKNGSGTLVLSSNNTYSGGTTLNAGTIQLAAANALGTSGNITFAGGTLQYGSGISTDLSPRLKNSTSAFAIDTNGESVTFASAIDSTNSGGLSKSGAGTLVLSGANTFTGGVTLQAGTLSLGNNAALGTGTFTITGGTIDATAARTTTNNNAQNWNGNFTFAGSNTLNLGTGAITLGANRTVTVAASTLTVGAIRDGGNAFGLTKEGAGTLVLTGTHTYTGATTINAGTLTIGNINSLSSTGTAVTVNSGGTLSNNTNISSSIGSLAIYGGAMNQNGGTITASSASILTNNGSYVVSGNASILRFNTAAVTMGNFSFSYNNASNAGAANGLVISAGLTVQDGATVNFTNNSTGIGGIGLNGNQTFTVGTGATMNAAWAVNSFNGTSGLTKNGSGTLVLSANNIYIGATTINAGTLSISSITNGGVSGALGNSTNAAANLVLGAGTLEYTGSSNGSTDRNFTLTNGTTSTISVTNATTSLTISGAAATTNGSLTKAGAGTLILSGNNAYTGTTMINAGTIIISGGSALADTGAVTLANTSGAVLSVSTSETIGSLSGGGASGGNIVIASGQTLTINQSANATFSGAISGANLVKTGSGTLTVNGSNAYTGTTTVNSGTLAAASSKALGNSTVINVNTGSLLVTAASAVSDSAAINLGGGTLAVSGAFDETVGLLTLSANSTIDLDGFTGTLRFGGVGSWSSGATLAIWNWNGINQYDTPVGNGAANRHVVFTSDIGLDSYLDRISFYSGSGTGFAGNAFEMGFSGGGTEIIAVPEPETWATAAIIAIAGLLAAARSRAFGRRFHVFRNKQSHSPRKNHQLTA